MIIITNKFIPFGDYETINLFGVLFTKGYVCMKERNHEKIHTEQIKECSVLSFVIIGLLCCILNLSIFWILLSPITFYVLYFLEYFIIRFFHKKQINAYYDISFEEEAYANEDDFNYIKDRCPFSWIKYVKLKSKK